MKRSGLETASEATLVFGEFPRLDPEVLITGLAPFLNGTPVIPLNDEAADGTGCIKLQTRGCIVTVTAGRRIRKVSACFEALDWPMLHRTFPDAESVLRAHDAQVVLRVETEYDAVAKGLGMRSANTSYGRNLLAGQATAAICSIAMPAAIHWKGCEMLYRPDMFLRAMEAEPVALFVRVTPFSSNRQIEGVRAIGASTRGAFDLLGKEVVLEEAPVPVDWVMRTLHGFIAHCQNNGGYPAHQATYATPDGDAIVVRHLTSTPDIPEDHISLEVRRAVEPGYEAASSRGFDVQPKVARPAWDGKERRTRPATAKPFGRRGLR
ncbi:hypothetical protein [Oricola thermophila]|nr:hypothetical protein [Oricola thermophila]